MPEFDPDDVLAQQGRPLLDGEASFMATMAGGRILTDGGIEIKLHVPQGEKRNALPLTDAAGIMVVVTVRRKRRDET